MVIAILAAISVAVYNGIQNRTNDTAVQNDLKAVATKLELYRAEFDIYPSTGAQLTSLALKLSKSSYELTDGLHNSKVYNFVFCRNSDASKMALVVRAKSGKSFQYTNGSVAPYTGPLQSNMTEDICASAGITVVASPASWIWFYNINSWQAWAGS